jgi:protocatechuate 3,4-dioxygenase beta subunit
VLLAAALTMAALAGGGPGAGAQGTCKLTPADSEGPFYVRGAPERGQTGKGLVVFGTVRSQDCRPIGGVTIEWWSAGPNGEYDAGHRATTRADAGGLYRYETDFPGRYPGRPPHVHLKITAPGHRTLITQIYPTAGQTSVPMDLVLAKE